MDHQPPAQTCFPRSAYLICLTPFPLLAYLGLESYGVDYRAFYLAGKAVLQGLDPYLNHIAISSDFYGPINAELAYYSGWKYPPLSSYFFAPFALLPYEMSKAIFIFLSFCIAASVLAVAIHFSKRTLPPESVLIALVSFPIVATVERGQIEIALVSLAVIAVYLISRGSILVGIALIFVLASVKVYPFLLALIALRMGRSSQWRSLTGALISFALILGLTCVFTPSNWQHSFRERMAIEFDRVPGKVLASLPADSGVIEGSSTVRSSDSRNLIHSHDFVFGFGNPLLTRQTFVAGLLGLAGVVSSLYVNRHQALFQQSLALMPWINIANPLSWIMGLVWYLPLFFYSYGRLSPRIRFLACLPLILPPALNASAYLAAVITLVIARCYKPDPAVGIA